jgi:putative CRISPR-associated protein (TIGR02620 family)
MNIVISRHEAVRAVIEDRIEVARFYDFFRPEILRDLPPGSTVIGNMPVPVAAAICRAGHHYQHVIIPRASDPSSLTYAYLSRNMELSEFHIEEID